MPLHHLGNVNRELDRRRSAIILCLATPSPCGWPAAARRYSLLPIVVPPDEQAELFAATENPDAVVKIDLPSQTLPTPGGRKVEFPIDAFSKHCLLEGVDELGYILKHETHIAAYEARRVGSIDTLE